MGRKSDPGLTLSAYLNHPGSEKVSFFTFSPAQYPFMTFGPRIQTSPNSPLETSFPLVISLMLTSTPTPASSPALFSLFAPCSTEGGKILCHLVPPRSYRTPPTSCPLNLSSSTFNVIGLSALPHLRIHLIFFN